MKSHGAARRKRYPRWLRLQFGLRSLLLVTLVVCLALSWYVERVRRQRLAVAALKEAGAEIDYYDGHNQYAPLDPNEFAAGKTAEQPDNLVEWIEWATPRRLRTALGIDFFHRVDSVRFDWNFEFPHDLSPLGDLGGLRELRLHKALDDDLAVIGALEDLTRLDISDSIISDAGLTHLRHLRKLESLAIRFDQQYVISLSHQPITDAGLAHFANLRRLKFLDLSGASITGEGLGHLAAMDQLERLDLGETKLGDVGLVHLARLPQLRSLNIHDTVITPGIAEKMLPKARVQRYNTSGAPALTRGQALAHAGRWEEAIEALIEENASDPGSPLALYSLGQCHAELEQWDRAVRLFCKLLDDLAHAEPSLSWFSEDRVWQQLYEWPQVFERVAQSRPNDVWRWVTSAQRAVVEGRWADATAGYERAMGLVHGDDLATICGPLTFQYGASRILAQDLPAQARLCARLFDEDRRFLESAAKDPWLKDPYTYAHRRSLWLIATHLWLLAPQGAISASEIATWRRDEVASSLERELSTLFLCREGKFKQLLDHDPPKFGISLGRSWFCRAMAHQCLGNHGRALECFARGSHWLDRRMKEDRARGVQRYAADFLEAEVLRREAENLIYK
jgi:tetratricopeptide (TPR) repeat protein